MCRPKHLATHSRHIPLSTAGVTKRISHKDLQDTRFERYTFAPTETTRDETGPDTETFSRHPKKKEEQKIHKYIPPARPEAVRKCRTPFALRPFVLGLFLDGALRVINGAYPPRMRIIMPLSAANDSLLDQFQGNKKSLAKHGIILHTINPFSVHPVSSCRFTMVHCTQWKRYTDGKRYGALPARKAKDRVNEMYPDKEGHSLKITQHIGVW